MRAWRLLGDRLASLYRPVFWEPGRAVEAECQSVGPVAPHPAPARGCRCGLYAAHRATQDSNRRSDTGESLPAVLGLPSGSERDFVLGEVKGWGEVEIAEKGWRSQYQRVHALYDTHPEAGRMAELYGVPLVRP